MPERYTALPGCGLGMRLTSSPHKNYSLKILAVGEAMAQNSVEEEPVQCKNWPVL